MSCCTSNPGSVELVVVESLGRLSKSLFFYSSTSLAMLTCLGPLVEVPGHSGKRKARGTVWSENAYLSSEMVVDFWISSNAGGGYRT